MSKYKLFKATVEHTFVFVAGDVKEADISVKDIMLTHGWDIVKEGLSHQNVEPVNDEGDLPAGWEVKCLPWSKYTYVNMPEELVNKQILTLL
jgi:uncharacterized protein YbdZ (MbtH family)